MILGPFDSCAVSDPAARRATSTMLIHKILFIALSFLQKTFMPFISKSNSTLPLSQPHLFLVNHTDQFISANKPLLNKKCGERL